MSRGDTNTVTAAVTINQSLPAPTLLRRAAAAQEVVAVVSCRIQARLNASPYEFDVTPEGWVERSLLTTDTARWSWYVTPKVGGTQTLDLDVRPIVKLKTSTSLVSAAESDVQEYETTVHVDVPWSQRPQEMMSRLAATFKVAQGLIEAMTGVIVALAAFGSALGIRRLRRRGVSDDR